jgi:hypothetical protein
MLGISDFYNCKVVHAQNRQGIIVTSSNGAIQSSPLTKLSN